MRKTVLFSIIVVVCLAMVSCYNKTNDNTNYTQSYDQDISESTIDITSLTETSELDASFGSNKETSGSYMLETSDEEQHYDPPLYLRGFEDFCRWANGELEEEAYFEDYYILQAIWNEGYAIFPIVNNETFSLSLLYVRDDFFCLYYDGSTGQNGSQKEKIDVMVIYLKEEDRDENAREVFKRKGIKGFEDESSPERYMSANRIIDGNENVYFYKDGGIELQDGTVTVANCHFIIDGKWWIQIIQRGDLQYEPFMHEILDWIDFGTVMCEKQ